MNFHLSIHFQVRQLLLKSKKKILKMPESEIDETNFGHQIRYFGKSFIVDQLNFVWIIEICHKSQ